MALHPPLRAEILGLLEATVLAGKQATGRTGMELWQVLVLGVVRLGLGAGWDRLERIANCDALARQVPGVPATPWGRGRTRPRGKKPESPFSEVGSIQSLAHTRQEAHTWVCLGEGGTEA